METSLTRCDVLDNGHVHLVDSMGSDLTVCNAARVSFNKETEWCSDQRAVTRLAETGSTYHEEDVRTLCEKDKKLLNACISRVLYSLIFAIK